MDEKKDPKTELKLLRKAAELLEGRLRAKPVPVFTAGDQFIADHELLARKIVLRPDEVATILRMTKRQVYHQIKKGALRSAPGKDSVLVYSSSVKEYLGLPP